MSDSFYVFERGYHAAWKAYAVPASEFVLVRSLSGILELEHVTVADYTYRDVKNLELVSASYLLDHLNARKPALNG